MWKVSEHTDSENNHYITLRTVEWIHFPLWISMAIVPVLLFFFDWRPVLASVVALAVIWRVCIARNFVLVWLANIGALGTFLAFVTCPVMSFLIWRQVDKEGALIALLWPPLGFPILMRLSNKLFSSMLRPEFEYIRRLFANRLKVDPKILQPVENNPLMSKPI